MQSGDCLPGFTNQFGESSSDRQAMRRVPPELSKPVRRASHRPPRRERASPASPIDRHCTNAERRLLLLSQRRERVPRLPQPVRRVVLRPPSTAASFPSTAAQGTSFSGFSEQSKPMRRVIPRKSRSSLNCAQNKNSSQHSPSVTRVSKCNGIRAHTHASTRRLCRPCLCVFYNFFINIILFYYWVTNRDFIDLFCHTPQT